MAVVTRNGIATITEYDMDGNPTLVVRQPPVGPPVAQSVSTYDAHGRLVDSWSPATGTTTYAESFTAGGGRVRATVHEDGGTRIEEYYRDGRLKEVSGTAATPVRYEYGVEQIDGFWCEFVKTIRPGPGGVVSEWTKAYTDPFGRQSVVVRNPGAPAEQTTTYVYDDADRVVSVTVAAGGLSQTTAYEYDDMGRRIRVTLPGNVVQHAAYDLRGQTVAVWGDGQYPVDYAYDPQGRMVAMTTWKDFDQQAGAGTAGAATTLWLYNPLRGWLDRKEYDDGNGADYAYTPAGRLASRAWARLHGQSPVATAYAYDVAGQQTLVDYSDATPDIATTYRRDGSVATISDASGTRVFAYHPDGSPDTVAYTAGPLAGHVLDYDQDALGRPAGHILENGLDTLAAAVYSYDNAGRLAAVAAGANSFAYGYAPGAPNRIATITANNGATDVMTTTKTYDGLDRLAAISSVNSVPSVVSSHSYQYNAKNQRTRATLADGSYWEYAYDPLGQVTGGIKKTASGAPIPGMAFGYAFDAIGNRLTSTENAATTTYAANLLNQYTARTVPGLAHVRGAASIDAIVTARPTVDGAPVDPPTPSVRLGETFFVPLPVDNAAAPFLGAAEVTAVLPNAAPGGEDIVATESRPLRIPQTSQTLTYDLDGNLTSDGVWTYEWNAENRLVAMETASALQAPRSRLTFAYDSQGRRFRKTVYAWQTDHWSLTTDHWFIYDNWNLIAELDVTTGQPLRTHLWGTDLSGTLQGAGGVGGLLSSTKHEAPSTTHTRFAAYDGNGNVTAYIDAATGAKSETFDYDPFGNTVVAEGDTLADLPFRFSTKFTDRETGLLYYGYRHYSPELGRWLNRDPLQERGGKNLYAFVGNAPVGDFDVLGRDRYQDDKKKLDHLVRNFQAFFPGWSLGDPDPAGMTGDEEDTLKLIKRLAASIDQTDLWSKCLKFKWWWQRSREILGGHGKITLFTPGATVPKKVCKSHILFVAYSVKGDAECASVASEVKNALGKRGALSTTVGIEATYNHRGAQRMYLSVNLAPYSGGILTDRIQVVQDEERITRNPLKLKLLIGTKEIPLKDTHFSK